MKKGSEAIDDIPLPAAKENQVVGDPPEEFGTKTGDVALAAQRRLLTLITRITKRCWGFDLLPQSGREIWQRVFEGVRRTWGSGALAEKEITGIAALVAVAEGWWETGTGNAVWLPLHLVRELYST